MANGWRVTGQRGTQEIVNGRLMPAMEVNVVTDAGVEKSFIIPDANYTAEKVTAIVDAWYERAATIDTL